MASLASLAVEPAAVPAMYDNSPQTGCTQDGFGRHLCPVGNLKLPLSHTLLEAVRRHEGIDINSESEMHDSTMAVAAISDFITGCSTSGFWHRKASGVAFGTLSG
jgi:hypothetical protein